MECVDHLKDEGKDARTLKLYGQEKNLTSSSIARMNMFLHGIEDFRVHRGDTLRNPASTRPMASKRLIVSSPTHRSL